MSGTGNLNILIAPMGHVERVVQLEHNHPEVQQQAAQAAASEMLRKENSKIAKNEPQPGAKGVDREKGHEEGAQAFADGDKKDRQDDEELSEEEPHGASSGNLWAGNILNLKV